MHTIFASANKTISAIKIIRVSGPKAKNVAKVFNFSLPSPKRLELRKLIFDKRIIDQAFVCWLPGPKTATGEDVFELHVHGSIIIEDLIYQALLSQKEFRIADKGEFTKRAVINGILDLTQAESINNLVHSETTKQLDLAHSLLEGSLKDKINNWRDSIVKFMSSIEVLIDFSDEDITEDLDKRLKQDLKTLIKEMEKTIKNSKYTRSLINGFKVAIIGKPNVGKSSLMNFILDNNVSIVTNLPGTTRDIIEKKINLNGYPVYFYDTAGIRKTKSIIENQGINKAKNLMYKSDVILHLSESGDFDLPIKLDKNKIINVRTKNDINKNKFKNEDISISVKKNIGIEDLLTKLNFIFKNIEPQESSLLVNKRQVNSLIRAKTALKRIQKLSFDNDTELIAEELRLSAHAVSSVTSFVDVEEVLDEIFEKFCIGK